MVNDAIRRKKSIFLDFIFGNKEQRINSSSINSVFDHNIGTINRTYN